MTAQGAIDAIVAFMRGMHPRVAYLVSQSNLALTGLATVATIGCLLVLAFMGLRELVR